MEVCFAELKIHYLRGETTWRKSQARKLFKLEYKQKDVEKLFLAKLIVAKEKFMVNNIAVNITLNRS